jgi:hypothetical protein
LRLLTQGHSSHLRFDRREPVEEPGEGRTLGLEQRSLVLDDVEGPLDPGVRGSEFGHGHRVRSRVDDPHTRTS